MASVMHSSTWMIVQTLASPLGTFAEDTVLNGVQWLRLGVEIIGAVVVTIGVIMAGTGFVRDLVGKKGGEFTALRLTLGRYLTLALEFQLGSDILSTAVSPTWTQIGMLAATAVIRTTLNFFLTRELREAGEAMAGEAKVEKRVNASPPG
ncbi:MAG: DUF1622 domain-containing protein [Gemmatimonadaceae bacterium]